MKRTLLILVLLVALLVGAGPFVTGMMAEKQIREYWERVDQQSELSVTVEDYQRSWMGATAKIKIGLAIPEENVPNLDIAMNADIKHGPIIFGSSPQLGYALVNTTLDVRADWLAMAKPFIGNQPIYQGETLFGFNNRVHATFKTAKVTFAQPMLNMKASWDGIFGTMKTDPAISFVKAEVTVGEVTGEMQGPDGQYNLLSKPLLLMMDLTEKLPFVAVGQQNVIWPGINVSTPTPGEQFMMRDFKTLFDIELKDNRLSYLTDLSIAEMLIANQFQLDNTVFQLDFVNFDAPAVSVLFQKIMALSKNNELAKMQDSDFFDVMKTLCLNTLQHGVVIDLKQFSLNLSDEAMEMRARVEFPPMNAQTPLTPDLLNQIDANLVVKLPVRWTKLFLTEAVSKKISAQYGRSSSGSDVKAMASEQVDKVLAKAISLGLLKQDGTQYVIDYKFDDGKLSLNGKEVPMMGFVQQIMQLQETTAAGVGQRAPSANPMPQIDQMQSVPAGAPAQTVPTNTGQFRQSEQPSQPGGSLDDLQKQQDEMLKEVQEQQRKQMEEINKQLQNMQ